MHERTLWAVLLAGAVLGCGGTATEVTIGDLAVVDVDGRSPDHTVLRVKVHRSCKPAKVAVTWGQGKSWLVASAGEAVCSANRS